MNALIAPVELTEGELDLVTGGAVVTGGLVNLTLTGNNIQVLTDHGIDINVSDITIKNLLNNNDLSVGAIIQILGGGAAILQHQA
jgi:hypothetical protein